MEQYMKRALELAEQGRGRTSPNPVVGAVLVKDGRIIGEGWHREYGGAHAEINAFSDAKEAVENADLYVTLEPCSHFGKTPPCARAIIERKIKRVFIGMKDINPLVAGRGIKMLQEAGIETVCGVLEEECKRKNEIFIKYMTAKTPFVVLKTAMTLDGKIASVTGDSRWVTGQEARQMVHKIRNSLTGILVGIQTVLQDDPLLTVRIENARNPVRIIADSRLRIPLTAKVLRPGDKRIVACVKGADPEKKRELEKRGIEVIETEAKNRHVSLTELMQELGKREIDSILLEGGGELNFSALKEGIVDRAILFLAPKIMGGRMAKTPVGGDGLEKMTDAIELEEISYQRIGRDFMIGGKIKKGEGHVYRVD